MPYKHPNGCTCLTFTEALTRIGEEEGKSGGEVLAEVMDDIHQSDREMEEQMWKPEVAAQFLLQEAVRDYKQYILDVEAAKQDQDRQMPESSPLPAQVLEVLEVEMDSHLRSGSSLLKARVMCVDGKERIASLYADWDSGDFYTPPEHETYLTWEELPTKS